MDSSILAALLGQGARSGQFAPEQTQEVAIDPVAAFPKSKYKEGLFGGAFGLGRTGGNILGILGDALLVGGGAQPIYSPRLQRAREAEALENFTTEPRRAIQQLTPINPDKALDIYGDFEDRRVKEGVNASMIRARDEDYRGNVQKRGLSLLKSATAETYPAVSELVKKYFVSKGIEPDFDVPASFADASRTAPWNSEISPEQQDRLESQSEYRDALLARRTVEEAGRNRRTDRTLSVRQEEGGANRGVRVSEGAKDRTSRETIAASRGRNRPKVTLGTRPDGTRYVIK